MLAFLRWLFIIPLPSQDNTPFQDVPYAREAYEIAGAHPAYREFASGINHCINHGRFSYTCAPRTQVPDEIIKQFKDKGYKVTWSTDRRYIHFRWNFSNKDSDVPENR